MTEFFGDYLRALTGAAVICGLATALTPAGKARRITALVSGFVMLVALISPLRAFDIGAYASELSRFEETGRELSDSAAEINDRLLRTIIQDECAAYILDKAASLGLSAEASVTARWNTDGRWYPYEAEITCAGDETARESLARDIEASLGIPEDRQYWSDTNE